MKKYLLSFTVIAIAIAAVAFTRPAPKKNLEQPWYYTSSTPDDHGNPAAYQKLTSQNISLCDGEGEVRCVIEAPELLDDEDQPTGMPDLDEAVEVSFKP